MKMTKTKEEEKDLEDEENEDEEDDEEDKTKDEKKDTKLVKKLRKEIGDRDKKIKELSFDKAISNAKSEYPDVDKHLDDIKKAVEDGKSPEDAIAITLFKHGVSKMKKEGKEEEKKDDGDKDKDLNKDLGGAGSAGTTDLDKGKKKPEEMTVEELEKELREEEKKGNIFLT
jgi:hypothetical protein